MVDCKKGRKTGMEEVKNVIKEMNSAMRFKMLDSNAGCAVTLPCVCLLCRHIQYVCVVHKVPGKTELLTVFKSINICQNQLHMS